jgi:type IV pilus assembly protein PilE
MKTFKADTGGFSLMELVITMAVLSILVAIAYPSYANFLLKGKRAEGRAALVELMQQQERYMTQNNTYFLFDNNSGVTNPASVPFKTHSGDSSTKPSYFLKSVKCDKEPNLKLCVKLVATLANPDSDPEFGNLELSSTGEKGCDGTASNGTTSSVCWK